MSDDSATLECPAGDVADYAVEWEGKCELFVPGLMIDFNEKGEPIFEDAWVPISAIRPWDQEIYFILRHGPGWISFPVDHPVKLREGTWDD